jgi:hypothetical protein
MIECFLLAIETSVLNLRKLEFGLRHIVSFRAATSPGYHGALAGKAPQYETQIILILVSVTSGVFTPFNEMESEPCRGKLG